MPKTIKFEMLVSHYSLNVCIYDDHGTFFLLLSHFWHHFQNFIYVFLTKINPLKPLRMIFREPIKKYHLRRFNMHMRCFPNISFMIIWKSKCHILLFVWDVKGVAFWLSRFLTPYLKSRNGVFFQKNENPLKTH